MSRFRQHKAHLEALCTAPDWKFLLNAEIKDADTAQSLVSPLLGLLPRHGLRWQAAYGLGLAVPLISENDPEAGRVVMRRLMWSLNEESGNLGWGVPEAMGCILANSRQLAKEYARIFLSYGYETGKDDNFLDHGLLRQGVYWGIGRLAQKNAAAARPALPHLIRALAEGDGGLCGMAAWAIHQIAMGEPAEGFRNNPEKEEWREALSALRLAENADAKRTGAETSVDMFDGKAIAVLTVRTLLALSKSAVTTRLGKGSA